MKPKNFSCKLNLNKKTIVNLNGSELKGVYGGGGVMPPQCAESYRTSCPTLQLSCNTCGATCEASECQTVCPYICR